MHNIFLIGTGNAAKLHCNALKDNPNFKITSIYDIDIKKSSKFITENNLKDVNLLYHFDESITSDIIIIASPHNTHFFYIKKFFTEMPNVKYLICEKPLYLSENEKILIDEFQKIYKDKILIPVMQNIYNPLICPLYEDVKRIDFTFNVCRDDKYYYESLWRGTKEHSDSVIMNQAIHFIDGIFRISKMHNIDYTINNVIFDNRFIPEKGLSLDCPDLIKGSVSFDNKQKTLFNFHLSTRSDKVVNKVDIVTVNDVVWTYDFDKNSFYKDGNETHIEIPDNEYSNFKGSKRLHYKIYERFPESFDVKYVTDFCIKIHEQCMKEYSEIIDVVEKVDGELNK